MNLNNANLRISAGNLHQIPDDPLPHIVMIGRSNVGKSSLINRLLLRKNLARTSSAPGKTATINFYEIDKTLLFVDLPGYGYAKVSQKERERWGRLIDGYLNSTADMRLMIQLIDIRHKPTADDRTMVAWLKQCGRPFMVVCTKADKLSAKAAQENCAMIRTELQLEPEIPVLVFSAEKGTGREALLEHIQQHIQKKTNEEVEA
ncbi:MAG: ribosome biogenesis GTP-binding protein YihA/YsxC [Eubacteriales bacterium]|jgi:GTP-binding protein